MPTNLNPFRLIFFRSFTSVLSVTSLAELLTSVPSVATGALSLLAPSTHISCSVSCGFDETTVSPDLSIFSNSSAASVNSSKDYTCSGVARSTLSGTTPSSLAMAITSKS